MKSNEKQTSKTEKKAKKSGSRFYRILYALLAKIVGWIFRIRVIGRENEPDEGGFIVCSNHIAASDPVVLCYAFKKHQVCFMAKKELFKIPLLSSLIRMLGAFPIDRGGNDVGAIKNAVNLVKEGKSMGIFPQGHRYPAVDPKTTKTKNGAALIATRAEANVIPAYIAYKNNTFKLFRKTYVIIGEPIPYETFGYDPDGSGEYARITDEIFRRVCALGEGFSPKDADRMIKENKKKAKESQKH